MKDQPDVLVVIAHPDDEVFASGAICLCRERGFRIGLVGFTDGEGGSRGILHDGDAPARLGEIRRLEVTLSAWALGVSRLWFMSLEDIPPSEWGAKQWNTPAAAADLARIVAEARPKLILTHGPLGGYGHPAHCRVGECVMSAVKNVAFEGSVFSFCGQIPNAFFSWRLDQPSDVIVDARGFLRRRMSSLSYHQSDGQFFLNPGFPRTARQFASAAFGFAAAFSEAGRKRIPIVTPKRFLKKFPYEGLVCQYAPPSGKPDFFAEHFSADKRVRLVVR
jgi:LmbE family N-acetylglucosaminyl deacetylase